MTEPRARTTWLRALRADVRIARRPAYVLIIVGVMLLAGLASAMTQDTVYQQLRNAEGSIRLGCTGELPSRCAQEQRERRAFLAVQQREGRRLGALQTLGGGATYAARTIGLGLGAGAVLLLAAMLVSAEAARGTLDLALVGGWTAAGLAVRRCCAIAVLMLGALGGACAGAWLAGLWGGGARPLPSGSGGVEASVLLGTAVLVTAYAAVASLAAWLSRKPVQTLFAGSVAIALLALTTPAGRWLPGAAAPGVLGLDRVLELEVGYIWAWPSATYSADGGEAAHVIDALPWAASAAVLVVLAAGTLAVAARTARSRPRA